MPVHALDEAAAMFRPSKRDPSEPSAVGFKEAEPMPSTAAVPVASLPSFFGSVEVAQAVPAAQAAATDVIMTGFVGALAAPRASSYSVVSVVELDVGPAVTLPALANQPSAARPADDSDDDMEFPDLIAADPE